MKKLVVLVLAIAASGARLAAQSTGSADVLLKAAQHAEEVQSDLRGAIAQYQKVVETGMRPQAAQALMHIAECYRKLGDAESRSTYQRLVREYPDQKELAAVAQARLGPNTSAARTALGDRAVWTGRDVDTSGSVSPDGRFISFVDWLGMDNVVLHDLATGANRPLTANTKQDEFCYGRFSTISRQGDRIAFEWAHLDGRLDVRVASLSGSGVPSSRVIHSTAPNTGTIRVRPRDWSPDAKWLAVTIEPRPPNGSSQVGVLSATDGELRVLKTVGWQGVNGVTFSPDGRFLAYGLADETHRTRSRIFVMPVDATQEVAVVDDGSTNLVMGWAADGVLVFASDRSGQNGLWTLQVTNGRAQGPARLANDNIGAAFPLGLTPSGSLYIGRAASLVVKVARLDLSAGTVADSAPTFQKFVDSRGRPRWSADGKHVMFVSCGTYSKGPCRLFLRSGDATVAREVPHGDDRKH